jgi:bifunctional UDP-N-acetylglucosamine pyrophosphorylase/glucosamine-1-phosphate N-acetyltransferase
MKIDVLVLAAGEGSRMRSHHPKPLHLICGRPMVLHVLHALEHVAPREVAVVVGHGADAVRETVSSLAPTWARPVFAEQHERRGTGDAAAVGLAALTGDHDGASILVVPGDTPLLTAATLERLVREHAATGGAATVLTSDMEDPSGYGRIIRDGAGRVVRIVEDRDADDAERAVREVNTGVYVVRRDLLGPALAGLDTDNAQGEYYLTDVVAALADDPAGVSAVKVDAAETAGVNDRLQLALAERELRARINRAWLLEGVTMLDPRLALIDVTVTIGRDVTIYPGAILQGATVIGDGCEIGPDTRLTDTVVGEGSRIANSVAEGSTIGAGARVGPYAVLTPGSSVAAGAETGPFYTGSP